MRSEYEEKVDELRTEHEAELDELRTEHEQEVNELRRDVKRLRNEKQALIADREEKRELVKYVEDEQSYREAPLTTRLRWWVWGKN
ncbi:hypothetical protein [Natrinema sp. SYSU A 869]|uniref:hypothetical protein n=1 Tax=Natrinema sp. SYSU A 869 TaxID=2871694 RepID=UPI001CA42475|nr:hypothetical protein [Natrinema sp. SYSU A 869]